MLKIREVGDHFLVTVYRCDIDKKIDISFYVNKCAALPHLLCDAQVCNW